MPDRLSIENKLPSLVRALALLKSDRRLEAELNQVILQEWAEPGSIVVLNELKRQAPEGSRWTEEPFEYGGQRIDHGRPSERLYTKTLADSWQEPYHWSELREGGFSLSSDFPVMGLILRGRTSSWTVTPRSRLLAWNRRFNNFGPPGQVQLQPISTIGPRPANRFSDRSADIARPSLVDMIGSQVAPMTRRAVARWLHFEVV